MKKILKFLDRFEDFFSSCFLVVMCVSIFLQIIARVIFKSPLLWTEEISRYSYIWCVFLCISMGEHYCDHFCVDIFLKWVHGRADKIIYAIEKLIAVACYVYVFYWSLKFFKFELILSSPALGMTLGVIASALCVGFFFAIVRTGTHFVRLVKEAINYKEEADK